MQWRRIPDNTTRGVWLASMAMVIVLSLSSKAGPPMVFNHSDLLLHCLAYAWLAALPRLSLARDGLPWAQRMAFLGAGLELAQGLVPQRTPSMLDLLANCLGVLAGVWLGGRLRPWWRRPATL